MRSGMFLAVLLSGALLGCRLQKKASTTSETPEFTEDAFQAPLSATGRRAAEEIERFGESLGVAFIGKVGVNPDLGADDRDKSNFHEFLTPKSAALLQEQLLRALDASVDGGRAESALFVFEGCKANPLRFDPADLLKLGIDYDARFAVDLPAGPEARADCGRLLHERGERARFAALPNLDVQFEFYVTGELGNMHQVVLVTSNVTRRPAVFRLKKPLSPNVVTLIRPNSWQRTIGVQILPTSTAFTPAAAGEARKLLGLVIVGRFQDPPTNLKELSRQWYAVEPPPPIVFRRLRRGILGTPALSASASVL